MSIAEIFKAYDIRGTYPDQLNEELARAMGSAFAEFSGTTEIVVGRDMRPSGVALVDAFAEGARRRGVGVVEVGLCSTDFLYFASGYLDRPGAMFTASHNPAQYNGIKLTLAGAVPVGADSGLKEIAALTEGFLARPAEGSLAPRRAVDLTAEWVTHVHRYLNNDNLRPLHLVADTANGMGGLVVPQVFADLPFRVDVLYGELDGTFPNHPADPLNPDNLVDVQARVLEEGADAGLAFDGDADRVFLIDELARPVSGSTVTAMVAAALLAQHPGATILYNLICSRAVPEVIEENGGVPLRTRVGHSYIKQVMAESGAVFGGEHSGHYYYADNYRADSGIITAMIVLDLLAHSEQTLSQLTAPFERYAASGEVNLTIDSPLDTIERLAAHYANLGAAVDRLDGLSVNYPEWWFNVRPSNTEPLLRLNVEAASDEACRDRVDEVRALIEGEI